MFDKNKFLFVFGTLIILGGLFIGFQKVYGQATSITTFSDGTSSKTILFPVGGGTDNSAKVAIPMGQSVFSAKVVAGNDLPLMQPVVITENSGTDLTDYAVFLTVDTASLIGAGKMRNDCGDMRFKDDAGNDLFYWLESGCNTGATKVWVKVPSLPGGGEATIYMHYDRPTLVNNPALNNPNQVFLYADDFESYASTAALQASWNFTTNGNPGAVYHADLDNTDFQSPSHSLKLGYFIPVNLWGVDVWSKVEKNIDIGATLNTHLKFKERITAATLPLLNYIKVFVNGVEIWSSLAFTGWEDKDIDLSAFSGVVTIGLLREHENTFVGGFDSYWDDIIVRQVVAPEPTFVFGAEQAAAGVPIINARMDVGSDGTMEWQDPYFVTVQTISGLKGVFNGLLEDCTCAGCAIVGTDCVIDLEMLADSDGAIMLSGLAISYGLVSGGLVPCGRNYDDKTTAVLENSPCTLCHTFLLIKKVIDLLLLYILLPLGTLGFVAAGVLFLSSAGDPGQVGQAKTALKITVLGVFLAFASWILMELFVSAIVPGSKPWRDWRTLSCPVAPCVTDTVCDTANGEDSQNCSPDCPCDFNGDCSPLELLAGVPQACPDCAVCRDGVVDVGERCDPGGGGAFRGGINPVGGCAIFGYASGDLSCTDDCEIDLSGCSR